jgi:hypothetical protein
MPGKRDEFLEQMKKKLDDFNYRWNLERNKLEAKIQQESAGAKKKLEADRDDLLKFRKEMKEKIIDLEVAGENAWDDVKDGVENAWKALSKSFDKATSHFKK